MVLVSRSYDHLRAVFDEYRKIAGKDIEDSLKSEMSGDLLNGFLTVGKLASDVWFSKTDLLVHQPDNKTICDTFIWMLVLSCFFWL